MKKVLAVCMAAMMCLSMTAMAFAASAGVTAESVKTAVIDPMVEQVSVTTILGVVAAGIGVAIGFVFMWWAGRKLLQMFFSGFRKGKINA